MDVDVCVGEKVVDEVEVCDEVILGDIEEVDVEVIVCVVGGVCDDVTVIEFVGVVVCEELGEGDVVDVFVGVKVGVEVEV